MGATSLIIRCGRYLLDHGHQIVSVYSDEAAVRNFFSENEGVRAFPLKETAAIPLGPSCDILFSIANEKILSEEIISFPAIMSVNYHDSLLPSFAGRNASAWCIYHRRPIHGITWHVMHTEVDAGDILIQESLGVSEDDTAFALNTRCYDTAFQSFQKLVGQLENGTTRRTPMDMSTRTYFNKRKRLPNGGIVDWHQPARDIVAAVRASDFGPYPPALGTVKTRIGGQWIVIKKATTEKSDIPDEPGAIVSCASDRLVIASGGGRVVLLEIADLTGRRVALSTLSRLQPARADAFSSRALQDAGYLCAESMKHETYWAGCLKEYHNLDVSSLGIYPVSSNSGEWEYMDFPLRREWSKRLGLSYRQTFVLLFSILLWRMTGDETISLNIQWPVNERVVETWRDWLVTELPLIVKFNKECTLLDVGGELLKRWDRMGKRQPVLYDNWPGVKNSVGISFLLVSGIPDFKDGFPDYQNRLAVMLCEREGLFRLYYYTSVLSREQVRIFLSIYLRLKKEAALYPGRRLCELNILSGREKRLQCLNPLVGRRGHPFVPVIATFFRMVRKFPDQYAIRGNIAAITYGVLGAGIIALTEKLACQGVGRGSIVVVCMDRNEFSIASILAVLATGAAYLPIDVKQPMGRIEEIVRDSKASLIMFDQDPTTRAPAVDIPTLIVGGDVFGAQAALPRGVLPAVRENDPAYVIYTSGSTGRPKGTVVSHGSLSRFMRVSIKTHHVSSKDRILQLCSLSFDASVEEIFSALLTGATLYFRTNEMLCSFTHFMEKCREWGLTVIGLFPDHLQNILEAMEKTGSFPETIRLVTTGGEKIQPGDVRRWQLFFKNHAIKPPRLVNVYGLTETTIASLVCDLTFLKGENASVSIGRPLKGTFIHILDQYGQPVPCGIPGEIYIGGSGVALGYLHDKNATNARFVPDPLYGSERMFKTGDFGKFAADGKVFLLGRKDHQIKSMGFRVELEEIQTRLRQLPGVRKAAVIHHNDGPTARNVIAAFLLQDGKEIAADILMADEQWQKEVAGKLSDYLPPYMVPSHYYIVKEMPLDEHGKIDRGRLRSLLPKEKRSTLNTEMNIPEIVGRLWEEIIPGESGRRERNFFDSGGDSISAVEFITRLEGGTGISLSLEDVFSHPDMDALIRIAKTKIRHTPHVEITSSYLPPEIVARFRVVNK